MPRSLQELYQDNLELAKEFSSDEQLQEGVLDFLGTAAAGLISGSMAHRAYKAGKSMGGNYGFDVGQKVGGRIGRGIGEKVGGIGLGLAVGSIAWMIFNELLAKNKKQPSKQDIIDAMSVRVGNLERDLSTRGYVNPVELRQIQEEIRQLEQEIAEVSRLNEGVKSFLYKNTPNLRKFGDNVVSGAKKAAGKVLSSGFNATKAVVTGATKKVAKKFVTEPAKSAGTAIKNAAIEDAKTIGGVAKSGLKKLASGTGKGVNAILNPSATIADKFTKSSNPVVAKVANQLSSENMSKAYSTWHKPKSMATIAAGGAADVLVYDSVGRAGKAVYNKVKKDPQDQQAQQDQQVQQTQDQPQVQQTQQYQDQPQPKQRKLGDPNRRLKKFGPHE